MKIAIDISPLKSGHFLQHRVRGTGFYIENLKKSLQSNFPKNEYIFFQRGDSLPEDVSVIHCTYFEPFFITIPLNNLSKTVITVHDLTPLVFPEEFPAGLKGTFRWQLQKFLLKRCAGIITDSESSKKDIIRIVGVEPEKVVVVYLAAGDSFKVLTDKKEIRNNIQKKYDLPETFALYVGDATWNKNLPRLVGAATKADIPLVMVGKALVDEAVDIKNPWNKDLNTVHKLSSNNKNIIRLGFVSEDDLIALYNLATVFVMPSLYEGFGLPILEAMQSGCPVVTCKQGSIPEVAGEAAYYVDPYSEESIAQGIKEVISDTKLQNKLSQAGLNQAKKFSWAKTAEKTMEVYEANK